MVPLLTLHQLAHTVWRLQLCADLEGMIKKFAEVRRTRVLPSRNCVVCNASCRWGLRLDEQRAACNHRTTT
jgi:hypothetical protein